MFFSLTGVQVGVRSHVSIAIAAIHRGPGIRNNLVYNLHMQLSG